MEFFFVTHPSEVSFYSTFDKAGKIRRDRGNYYLKLDPANPADVREFESLFLQTGAISINGNKPKDLAALDPGFNEPEMAELLKELQKVHSQLPALDDDADTAAAEAEIMKVALGENSDLANVPAMIAEQRKKRDQAEEAAIMRDTAERRVEKLTEQIKNVLRARRKRDADRLKKILHEAAEAFNRDLEEAYAKFNALRHLFKEIAQCDSTFPQEVTYRSPAFNIADGGQLKNCSMRPAIRILPNGQLWFELKPVAGTQAQQTNKKSETEES